jgi:hypothetical protein
MGLRARLLEALAIRFAWIREGRLGALPRQAPAPAIASDRP